MYGVIAYNVSRRSSEIGVRMAVGAARSHIVALVLRECVLLLSIGLACGVALALAASRAATSLLFGLKPDDPATFGMATVILAAIALAASYLPALRASKLDPLEALRHE